MPPGPTVGCREDPGLVTESRHTKVGITNVPPLCLTLKIVFRLKDGLIMGLVVQRIGLLKTFIGFQPSPEAGDRTASFHILCQSSFSAGTLLGRAPKKAVQ